MSDFSQPLNQIWSLVSIMDNHREYTFYMKSGIRTKANGRLTYEYTQNRENAQKFSKLTAEELVASLRTKFGRVAKVEVA